MVRSIFDSPASHGEASTRVAFAHNRLDRQSEDRPDDAAERALSHPGARAFAIGRACAVLADEGEPKALFSLAELAPLSAEPGEAVLLGYEADGAPRLAVPVPFERDGAPDAFEAIDLRTIYTTGRLSGERLGELAQATSLVTWNRSARFCGHCGAPTHKRAGGYRRECSACGTSVFPRTDPVVIMLVVDEARDRCLLGRSPHFRPGMYSCLAGFLEPGETVEDAVRRETMEESGIAVARVRYHASQPWPMPHTLMIGLYGEAASGEISHATSELEDCRWFAREETAAMLDRAVDEGTAGPPDGAIANRLMRDWIDWPHG
ncbi:NAD(+) diphosphatase [Pararhizobium mangrovi]|uniref:NAD(+) diphosphatase n=1 Tax=Pararhizobium mangrovi TaxID=2590452 RepID=A0A506U4T1_9HYPH|nr:NAD(+) diphosphatase [Pararhizobium mangrovi]TPW28356.1 NAD(+) diphosphatase [Pararhizobium mangrovi]